MKWEDTGFVFGFRPLAERPEVAAGDALAGGEGLLRTGSTAGLQSASCDGDSIPCVRFVFIRLGSKSSKRTDEITVAANERLEPVNFVRRAVAGVAVDDGVADDGIDHSVFLSFLISLVNLPLVMGFPIHCLAVCPELRPICGMPFSSIGFLATPAAGIFIGDVVVAKFAQRLLIQHAAGKH